MEAVKVYRFKCWNNLNGDYEMSLRWATRAAIERTRIGVIIEESETDTAADRLDEDGMLARGENPQPPRRGFQTFVER